MLLTILLVQDPWYSTYVHFAADALSSSTYTAHTPVATLVNRGDFERDGAAAYQNALVGTCSMCIDVLLMLVYEDVVYHRKRCICDESQGDHELVVDHPQIFIWYAVLPGIVALRRPI